MSYCSYDKNGRHQIKTSILCSRIRKCGVRHSRGYISISRNPPTSDLTENVAMEWSQANTLKLIKHFEFQRVLWDVTHSLYYHQIVKHEAWDWIGHRMGCSSNECKQKMNSLLATMRTEVAKVKRSTATAHGKYLRDCKMCPLYSFFAIMHFIDP